MKKQLEIQNMMLTHLSASVFEMLRRDTKRKRTTVLGCFVNDCDHSGRGKRSIRAGDRNE